jgi:hypothetical protein
MEYDDAESEDLDSKPFDLFVIGVEKKNWLAIRDAFCNCAMQAA